jgi:transposase-like protein
MQSEPRRILPEATWFELYRHGAAGLEKALATLWSDVPTQRCTVHKHRNSLAHAPRRYV